ncbi:sugar MFS transporter [Shewanella sp. C32]|uniref:Sugar MFS transporter n=1 Tax=Shewanella electrica TaxID=515560 RepID=A0ABT2FFR5_9GAMM|nr:sugar MFS transporter [Shewanella electrica]MCH1925213.1 sugar MFS transporter [Shewanella electrica]MCS4555038.1 sugar MFS transporter [Shewanella electrica]
MTTLTRDTPQQSTWLPMTIIGTLFFVFGFVTWLNGALVPFLQIVCDLSGTEALLISSSFYIAYVVMALPMSYVLNRTGYRNAMSLGLGLIALGCVLFAPAAETRQFSLFIVAQFIVGSGLTILQTASNPYLVKIGSPESAAARISIMGLLNKGAGWAAPQIFAVLVMGQFAGITQQSVAALSEAERALQIQSLADSLVYPYLGMAVALVILAVALRYSGLPEIDLHEEDTALASQHTEHSSVLQFPHLVLGVMTLFCYVGVEVIAGDTIGLAGSELGVDGALSLTSFTMCFMVLGYLLGLVLIPRLISQQSMLMISAGLGIVLALVIPLLDAQSTQLSAVLWGWLGIRELPDPIACIALLGLANAIVWPAVWPLALAGLGHFTARGSALLIMGIAGGAVLPLLFGVCADYFGIQEAYLMTVPCYAFILFYAVKGHRIRHW